MAVVAVAAAVPVVVPVAVPVAVPVVGRESCAVRPSSLAGASVSTLGATRGTAGDAGAFAPADPVAQRASVLLFRQIAHGNRARCWASTATSRRRSADLGASSTLNARPRRRATRRLECAPVQAATTAAVASASPTQLLPAAVGAAVPAPLSRTESPLVMGPLARSNATPVCMPVPGSASRIPRSTAAGVRVHRAPRPATQARPATAPLVGSNATPVTCWWAPAVCRSSTGLSEPPPFRRPRGSVIRWRTTPRAGVSFSSGVTAPVRCCWATPGSSTARPGCSGLRRQRRPLVAEQRWRSTPPGTESCCLAAAGAQHSSTTLGSGTALPGLNGLPRASPRRAPSMR